MRRGTGERQRGGLRGKAGWWWCVIGVRGGRGGGCFLQSASCQLESGAGRGTREENGKWTSGGETETITMPRGTREKNEGRTMWVCYIRRDQTQLTTSGKNSIDGVKERLNNRTTRQQDDIPRRWLPKHTTAFLSCRLSKITIKK